LHYLLQNKLYLLSLLLLLPFTTPVWAAPTVSKVEPPGWWAGHSINPVRLLIRGTELGSARLITGEGLKAGLTSVNEPGTYMFVDLHISPRVSTGIRKITLLTATGRTQFSFNIMKRDCTGPYGIDEDDLIYLIMPDRFSDGDPSNNDPSISQGLYDRGRARYYHGGDFQGVINNLKYLKGLGVTALWLNPVYDNHNQLNHREVYDNSPITDYHGYGAVDFYGVEEHFGSLEKLQELVREAHKLNIKVIQDQVANHTGPYHPWVKDSPTPDWFNGTESSHLSNTWQTWTLMDPFASYDLQKATLEGWFINILPDLNQANREVSQYIIQNSLWWIGVAGFDAIRQDTLPYVPRQFWKDWSAALKREYPKLTLIGEVFDGDPILVSFFQGGRERFDHIDSGIDTLFDFPLFFPLRRAFAEGKPLKELAMMMARDHLYVNANLLVTFMGLHDVSRFMSETGANTQGMKLAQTFLLTNRGVPLLYYGDEIGMRGGQDPDNRRDFPNLEEQKRLNVEQIDLREHVKKVAQLRAVLEPLRRGRLLQLLITDQQYVYARITPDATVIVAINNATDSARLTFSTLETGITEGSILVDKLNGQNASVQNNEVKIDMAGRSSAIFVSSDNSCR
jgi:neopullulanase